MRYIKLKATIIFSLLLLILAACGSQEAAVKQEDGSVESEVVENKVVEIENNEQILVFTEVPKRAVTLNQHVTEVMLALGLEEFMVGTAYLDDEILPKYKEAYDKIPVLAEQYPSQEIFLSVEPDFAYAGWSSAFREGNVGTVEALADFDIHAYLHHSSTKVGPTIDDIYLDIRNIARIFNVEERGEKLIEEINKELEEIQEKVPQDAEPLKVFVYDSGETAAFTVAKNFLNSMITMAGAKNIFSDIDKNWAEVSWEEVVDRDPEVIVIVDYGDTSAEEKKARLLNHPALTDATAIKNGKFIITPLSAAAEGIRASHGLAILVDGLYQ